MIDPHLPAMSQRQEAALRRSITPIRLSTYVDQAGDDPAMALRLYWWDRQLGAAFLADLSILEVALRNAMNARLTARWGEQWYSNPDLHLDDRTCNALNRSWSHLPGKKASKTPGRLIAQCMFGFWRGLLDKGGYSGTEPRRVHCDYEMQLWRGVLHRAFPGGRQQASDDGEPWTRNYAFAVVSRINDLRNRVAHHEPLINQIPLSGQRRRMTAADAHRDCLRLAAMLDRDLHALLLTTSSVPQILGSRP